jgi:hypothetical protein
VDPDAAATLSCDGSQAGFSRGHAQPGEPNLVFERGKRQQAGE